MRSYLDRLVEAPTPVLAWAVALLIGGIALASQVPLEWAPRVELPEVRISASWPGAAPRAVERYVTALIERAVQGVAGTAGVESLSQEGRTTITLQVSEGTPIGPYVARVNEQLALVEDALPDRVTPRLTKKIPEALRDQQGFMTLQLVGPETPAALRRRADEQIAPRLSSLPGVADVVVRGGTERELRVTLNPERLAALGVQPQTVRARLFEATSDAVYGPLRHAGRTALLLSPAEADPSVLRRIVVRDVMRGGVRDGAGPPGRRSVSRPASSGSRTATSGDRPRPVRPVRLEDVATVEVVPAPRRTITRIDGDPVVTITVDRAPGSPMLRTAEDVRARLNELRGGLPEGARLLVADDKSEDVRGQLDDLTWRGGLGLVLVLGVLVAMLQSLRAVGVVVFSVTLALVGSVALMEPLGLTLNLLTIAGLALVVGLLVDNSVVTTEQLILQRQRLMRERLARSEKHEAEDGAASSKNDSTASLDVEAARRALRAVGLPLVGGTLTTIAVTGPLVYLSGELRALFLPFAALVALTLGASLLSAAVIVPACGRFLPRPEEGPGGPGGRIRRWMGLPYRGAARLPKTTLLVIVLGMGAPLWLLPAEMEAPTGPATSTTTAAADSSQAQRLWAQATGRWRTLYNETVGSDAVQAAREWLDPGLGGVLRPFIEETTFGESYNFDARPEAYVNLRFPPGNPISRSDSLMQRFERIALASSSVERTLARIAEQSAYMRVRFYEDALQTAEPYVTRERLIQEATTLAGIEVSVGGLLPQGYHSGGGRSQQFRIAAYGPNYEDLEILCERLAADLKRASRRVAQVNTNAGRNQFMRFGDGGRKVLQFRWTPESEAQTGVSPTMLVSRLRPVLTTRFPSFYTDLDDETQVPVRILVSGADTVDVESLVDRPLLVGDSASIKLRTVTDYDVVTVPGYVERQNQQYRRYVSVDYRGPYRMGRKLIETVVEETATPPGYKLRAEQFGFFTDEVTRQFGWVIFGTIVLVFLVTAAVFESWRLPGVVLVSLPTALVGVAIGFLWAEVAFAEGAFIGAVLLVGIAANDTILLIDRYRQLRAERPHGDPRPLVRLAVRERLRPMWMTTLTSVVAMLPLLVFPQDGEFWTGLAVTVVGGLLSATLLAPMAVVALLTILDGSRLGKLPNFGVQKEPRG